MADHTEIHTPVMLERTIELLAPALGREGAILVDGTLGMGGHAEAFLTRFPHLQLIGIDRDTDALAVARERLAPFGDRVRFAHAVNDRITAVLTDFGVSRVSGILFDLGVSSLQLDESDRGFAYSRDAPLDMRMDQTDGPTAADVIATYPEGALRAIFERYGEEKLAARYARFIVAARDKAPIVRSGELVEVLVARHRVEVLDRQSAVQDEDLGQGRHESRASLDSRTARRRRVMRHQGCGARPRYFWGPRRPQSQKEGAEGVRLHPELGSTTGSAPVR